MKYTAITIGPIIETLNAARKTRELWGASYLFSYIIRSTVEKLIKQKVEILLPYYKTDAEWKNHHGAGLFPDRIFVVGEVDIQTSFYNIVIQELSISIANWFESGGSNTSNRTLGSQEIQSYLFNFLRFIQIHFECPVNGNIIENGTTLLDSKELQTKTIPENEFIDLENPLFYFLYHVNGSFLFKDGFCNSRKRFPSLIEIAIKEFELVHPSLYNEIEKEIEKIHEKFPDLNSEKIVFKNEDEIIEFIGKLLPEKALKQPHKYIAIVQADGDKIGQMVMKVGTNPVSIQNFSQKLMEFSKVATDIVVKYGGSPVYMGGDDLFFFAPLLYSDGTKTTHILEMVDSLNKLFDKIIIKYAKDILEITPSELPSLSFGISLSYYKFPLYEAKKMAFSALFEDIKWADKRNAVKVKFRKHSGQLMELFVNKNKTSLWDETILFISKNLDQESEFLSSFMHKLRLQDEVLFNKIALDANLLENFFKNNFNENYKSNQGFYSSLIFFIKEISKSVESSEQKHYLYAVLRFIHFLRN